MFCAQRRTSVIFGINVSDAGRLASVCAEPIQRDQKVRTTRRRLFMNGRNRLTVHNPMGYPPRVTGKALAPRVDTLNGKTVYVVDCRFDDSDVMLKQVQAWFADNLPS